jgi:preprotein translocase subunit SecA
MAARRQATSGAWQGESEQLAAVQAAIERHLRIPEEDRPLVPYPEQVAGARALLRGAVVEMATGEGKTITAAFAAALWARAGPVHVATANAYLAARDAAWLEPVYADLGLSVGVVTPETVPVGRREQYGRDIVYSTLSELGFDYLRDRMVTRPEDRVQVRGLGGLIVDEADLLLIDEARTPLVIARAVPPEDGPDLPSLARLVEGLLALQAERVRAKIAMLRGLRPRSFDASVMAAQVRRGAPRDPAVAALFAERPALLRAAERADRELQGADRWMLDDGLLFAVDERARTAYVTSDGQAWVEERTGPIFADPQRTGRTLAALHNLILAYALYQRDRDYLVRDGRVVLIEQATGRAAASRRLMRGLHAAIEVKELGEAEEETETLAQISVQGLVRLYTRRAGMTGTALRAADEFLRMYDMPVEVIPRHRPDRRVDLPPRLYRTAAEVDDAVLADIAEAHALGRPVLVGTADVRRSERLSARLTAAGLSHVVLNAREHAHEAAVIAQAGHEGAITIATAMAGRGTDIRLQPDLETRLIERAADEARRRAAAGPVMVVCASRRAAELLRGALGDDTTLRLMPAAARNSFVVLRSSDPSPQPPRRLRSEPADARRGGASPALGRQNHEGWHRAVPIDSRSGESGSPLRAQRARSAGDGGLGEGSSPALFVSLGLTVIATEPGTSRRLDDQLRGRAGRQGDEGLTRLYASLEDELLRFYLAPGKRARALRTLRGQPSIEGRAAASLIADAQDRAERLHAGQRQQLFKLDDVVEAQRRAFLRAYDAALAHPAVQEAVAAFIPKVAARDVASRPADAAALAAWRQGLAGRYSLARESLPAEPLAVHDMADALRSALDERFQKAAAEWGERWPRVARAVLLRVATEQWAAHVDALDEVQRQAPALFSFLSAPVEISYAREANRRYAGFNELVQAEALAALLTLPLPYERALPLTGVSPLSEIALAVPSLARTSVSGPAATAVE